MIYISCNGSTCFGLQISNKAAVKQCCVCLRVRGCHCAMAGWNMMFLFYIVKFRRSLRMGEFSNSKKKTKRDMLGPYILEPKACAPAAPGFFGPDLFKGIYKQSLKNLTKKNKV